VDEETSEHGRYNKMKRRGILILLVALVVTLLVNVPKIPQGQAIVSDTRNPLEDAYVREDNPESNYGNETSLKVFRKKSPGGYNYDVYFKFNLTGYGQITSATLRLYSYDRAESTDQYYVYRVANTGWSEGSITWNTAPSTGALISTETCGSTGWKEYDVTDYVDDAVLSGWDNVTIRLEFENNPLYGSGYNYFRSKEFGSNEPKILLEGYPEGTTAYNMFGAVHEETGTQDSAITCILTRNGEAPRSIEVDGWYNITESRPQVVWKFDLGNNVSRTYYLMPEQNETIYVLRPEEPYFTYTFNILDLVGLDYGYLETLFNYNGTDVVVERWDISLQGDLPFTLTWGNAYQLRLVTSLGTYYYPQMVATSDQNIVLPILGEYFPVDPTGLGNLTSYGTRINGTYIQGVFVDPEEETTWINMSVYEPGVGTATASVNVTADTLNWNWYDADASMDYYLRILVQHERRGLLEWIFVYPTAYSPDNPWSTIDALGGDFMIPPSQFIGLGILGLFIAGFSWRNSPVGLVALNIIAMFLQYFNWINFGWEWIAVSFSVSMLIALSLLKERAR